MDKGDWTHTTTCYISRTWTRRIEPHRTTWALNHWSTAASNNAYEPQKNNVRLIDIEYCGCKKICPCHILKTHSPIIYAAWSTCLFFDYPHTTMIDSPSSFPFLLACAVLKNIVMSFMCMCSIHSPTSTSTHPLISSRSDANDEYRPLLIAIRAWPFLICLAGADAGDE